MGKQYLGIEFGSTRIKAVVLDENFKKISEGSYNWQSSFENGIWTYSLAEAYNGLCDILYQIQPLDHICAMGISGMMHGYLALDKDWNILTPFRTWQNTITAQASKKLTELFGFPIPQRWSIAHLYQARLNCEPHINRIAHITTIAGYFHHLLTGENVIGIGEASGMFPIDIDAKTYDAKMLRQYSELTETDVERLLPQIMVAGSLAGTVTEQGSALVKGLLPVGIKLAPPEGDMQTGMVATNSVKPETGNISAGTSINLNIVLRKPLPHLHPEIDIVTTPQGDAVAMVHANNGTNDIDRWFSLFREFADLFSININTSVLYETLFRHSLSGNSDCGGVVTCNYLAGETITKVTKGNPFVLRVAGANFNLANFMRSQLFSVLSTLRIGYEILLSEGVSLEKLYGHGGYFKTLDVGQRYLAAAMESAIAISDFAGEGGPFGMALLASYLEYTSFSLSDFLQKKVFCRVKEKVLQPNAEDIEGFKIYLERFSKALEAESNLTNLLM